MDFEKLFVEIAQSNQTLAFLLLVAGNVVMGVLAALKDGRFELGELAGIFNKLFPMLGSYAALQVTGAAMGPGAGDLVEAASWGTMLPFVKGIVKDLREVGLPVEKVVGTGLADMVGKVDRTPLQVAFENWAAELNAINAAYRREEITDVVAVAKAVLVQEKYREHGVPGLPPGWPGPSA